MTTGTGTSVGATVGSQAPDFELRDQHGAPVRLSSFRGVQPVVLVFYPFAFTPTCTGELCALRDESSALSERAALLAVSCDPSPALRAFAEQEAVNYPLLSDFWPHGEVSRAYGAFLEDKGFATRATFLIDTEGIVRWSVVNPPGQARRIEDYRQALAQL